MARDPQEKAKQWIGQPSRTIFLVDEIREEDSHVGEYVTYCCVVTTAGVITDFLQDARQIRMKLPKKSQIRTFKGSVLFGSRATKLHEPMKCLAMSAILQAKAVALLVFNTENIRKLNGPGCGITLAANPGEGHPGRVAAPELIPLLGLLNWVANDLSFGDTEVDVIVDRSAKLGFDPSQRKIAPGEFEVIGSGKFNEISGSDPTLPQQPTSFRIIMGADQGPFMDLLMIPDVIAYLGKKANAFGPAKEQVAAGNAFWCYHVDMSKLR